MQIAKLWTNLIAAVRARSVKKLSAPQNDDEQPHSMAYAVAAFLFNKQKLALSLIIVQLLVCGFTIFVERHSTQNFQHAIKTYQRANAVLDRANELLNRSKRLAEQADKLTAEAKQNCFAAAVQIPAKATQERHTPRYDDGLSISYF